MQALTWLVKYSGHDLDFAYGFLGRAFGSLALPGRLCLLEELSWRPLSITLHRPDGQQDAAEFLCHILASAQPGAFQGTWQSRIQPGNGDARRYQTVDQGNLFAPLIPELRPGGLSHSITFWKSQYAIHALQDASSLLTIQLRRYSHQGSAYVKDRVPCILEAGELIYMPIFSDGLCLNYAKYRLLAVTYHLGDSPYSGQYKTALSVAKPDSGGQMQWSFFIVDDGKPPVPSTRNDIQEIRNNSYICHLLSLRLWAARMIAALFSSMSRWFLSTWL